jgi:hypothetical protein
MVVNVAGKSVSIAAIVAAVGGILAIVAAPLAWISLSSEGHTEDVTGLDGGLLGGKIALVLGILVIAVVVAGILNVKIPQSGAVLVVLGALILVVVALVYGTKLVSDESFTNTADMMKLVGGSASLCIGVILAVVGGILAIVGGAWSLTKKA